VEAQPKTSPEAADHGPRMDGGPGPVRGLMVPSAPMTSAGTSG
jgi:hypothetical protein